MATARTHLPVLRFAAIFSHEPRVIDEACEMAACHWGPLLACTADLAFDQTRYYRQTMGERLVKRLVGFQQLVDPADLVQSKIQANAWESVIQTEHQPPPRRMVNIDPGYLSEAKVVLATMKDRDHRLYLGQGVFGEVTLYYQLPGRWEGSRWTYPDYRQEAYHRFFDECRDYLRARLPTRNAGD